MFLPPRFWDYLPKSMEWVENHIPLRLRYEPPFNGTADCIFGLSIELCEVFNSTMYGHIVLQSADGGVNLLHSAKVVVNLVFVKSENLGKNFTCYFH